MASDEPPLSVKLRTLKWARAGRRQSRQGRRGGRSRTEGRWGHSNSARKVPIVPLVGKHVTRGGCQGWLIISNSRALTRGRRRDLSQEEGAEKGLSRYEEIPTWKSSWEGTTRTKRPAPKRLKFLKT